MDYGTYMQGRLNGQARSRSIGGRRFVLLPPSASRSPSRVGWKRVALSSGLDHAATREIEVDRQHTRLPSPRLRLHRPMDESRTRLATSPSEIFRDMTAPIARLPFAYVCLLRTCRDRSGAREVARRDHQPDVQQRRNMYASTRRSRRRARGRRARVVVDTKSPCLSSARDGLWSGFGLSPRERCA